MSKTGKIIILVALILAVGVVLAVRESNEADSESKVSAEHISATESPASGTNKAITLPRMVDLGADKCIPCKMMAPILEELRREYAGVFTVEFIDVWKNPDAAEKYGIRIIPTQIFFDATGKELFRHEGFYSKEDILAKWEELGVELKRKE
jgi:thioredoxin 1